MPLNKSLEELIVNKNKITTAKTKPKTPPSLLGMLRRIAYANKKYHSGWMCVGVTNALAGIKFSASIKL